MLMEDELLVWTAAGVHMVELRATGASDRYRSSLRVRTDMMSALARRVHLVWLKQM